MWGMCCNSPRQASSWKPATTANCASKWDFRKFHPSVEWFLRVRSLRSKSQTLCGSILIVFCVAFFNSAGILCRVLFLLVGPDIWPRTRLWFYACLKSEGDVALCADTWLCSCPPSALTVWKGLFWALSLTAWHDPVCPLEPCLWVAQLTTCLLEAIWLCSLNSGQIGKQRKSGFLVCRALLLHSEWNLLCLLSRKGN